MQTRSILATLILLLLSAAVSRAEEQMIDDFNGSAAAESWKAATVLPVDGGKVTYDLGISDGKLKIEVKEITSRAVQSLIVRDDVSLEPGQQLVTDILDVTAQPGFDTAGLCVTTGTDVTTRENLLIVSYLRSPGKPLKLRRVGSQYFDDRAGMTDAGTKDLPEEYKQLFIARPLPRLLESGYTTADGTRHVVFRAQIPEGRPVPGKAIGYWIDLRHVGSSATFDNLRIETLSAPPVVISGVFSDHMVLQRGVPVPVWGFGKPGTKVTVEFAGQTKKVTTAQDGRWTVRLDSLGASKKPQEMKVSCGGKTVAALADVLVGDVWLCSGQSNMEWPLAWTYVKEGLTEADFPDTIRWLDVPNRSLRSPQQVYSGSGWKPIGKLNHRHSAVGYCFARKVHQEAGVPIGMLQADLPGTKIETWTPPSGYELVPELKDMAAKQREERDKAGQINIYHHIHVNYNGMIVPILPYAIKGAIWYQGESNVGDSPELYFDKVRALLAGWRKLWGVGEFPFYFVQLANHMQATDDPAGGDLKWPFIREGQVMSLKIENTGMAVAIDVGDARSIHPQNKKDVGERLALWALAKDYGKKQLIASGPLYKGSKIEGDKIRITFDHVGSGLMIGHKSGDFNKQPAKEVTDGKLAKFAIAGEDKKWHWADAVIDGDTVVVSSKEVPKPVAVRYAFSANPQGCNLYSKEGLPASPFRTDQW